MRSTLKELRFFVRSILVESICPTCGNPNAYVGMQDVECPNERCANYSKKQKDLVGQKEEPVERKDRPEWTMEEDFGNRQIFDIHGMKRLRQRTRNRTPLSDEAISNAQRGIIHGEAQEGWSNNDRFAFDDDETIWTWSVQDGQWRWRYWDGEKWVDSE